VIDRVQDDISKMMAEVGCHEGQVRNLRDADVEWLEGVMKKHGDCVEELKGFVKPGTCEASARFHIVRSVCRRVERVAVRYFAEDDVHVHGSDVMLKYLNRLSDLLFVLGVKFR
jgi:cob(I)alamin adenosyltransferase